MSLPNLGSTTVAQIAIVVRNIEEASKKWSDLLGQPIPRVIVVEPGGEVQMTYKGQPSDAQAKLAFFSLGPVQLELIEPMGGSSVWQEALNQNGESVQHIAFWVEDMQKSVDFLRERNIPLVQRGDMGPGQYAYFDGDKELGITLELLEKTRKERAIG